MKKKIGFILIIAFALVAVAFSFSACNTQIPAVKLDTPANFVYNAETATLSWDPVEGAQWYVVSINDSGTPTQGQQTETASYSLKHLIPDIYQIRIVADSEERNNGYLVYSQSDWSQAKTYSVYAEFKDNYTILANNCVKIDGVGEHFDGGRLVIPDFIRADTQFLPNFEYKDPDDRGLHPIEQIGENAFKGKSNITSVEIGANVWNILDGAFENCENLATLDLSRAENLRLIGRKAFAGTKITEVILPESIGYIDDEAFKNTLLETVTVNGEGENLSFVGFGVFEGTPWLAQETGLITLEKVLIKYKVTEGALLDLVLSETDIKYFAPKCFEDSLLNSIDLTDFTFDYRGGGSAVGNAVQPYFLYGAANLTSVILPEDLSHIREYAFAGCSKLESINIYETILIDDGAFKNSGLKFLYTSGHAYPLGQDAFKDAPLETIFVYASDLFGGNLAIESKARAWNLPIEMFEFIIISE